MKNAELTSFRSALLQDIYDEVIGAEEGGFREEAFTEKALDLLDDHGETEGAIPCREIKENSVGNRIHKINGFAVGEGHDTIDLFITVFKGHGELGRLYSEEVKSAASLSVRFLQNVLSGKMEGIEDTAPVMDLVKTIDAIQGEIVRVNIYILSDMLIPLEAPAATELQGIMVSYHIRDIEYLYRLYASGTAKEAVQINFSESYEKTIPCLAMPEENDDYTSYLCIIPGELLADIYKKYGARLLEQNVRTFLQFRGNINKGIRDTILDKPHMFMAYNNGISATAESVELTLDGRAIQAVTDFQIVNGGQTTASIFQTKRKYKDLANLGAVSVQVKLTVISRPDKKAEIVSLISRYANTQNKVSEADLSSNHPFHIALEEISRKTYAPAAPGKSLTRWFYERARGQYNDELSQIDSKSQQKKWLVRNPKNQQFAKEDLARFYISWEEQPWWVVRGRQRSFLEFMKGADDLDVTPIFYEDLIAKAILFRTAERLYGNGAKAIGDLRYMVVPYTVAWLRYLMDDKINLWQIWKRQELSVDFQQYLKTILKQVDSFMRKSAPGGLIGEWAKKADCWKELKDENSKADPFLLKKELVTAARQKERYEASSLNEHEKTRIQKKIRKADTDGLFKVAQWGKATSKLTVHDLNLISRIVRKFDNKKKLTDHELLEAERIFRKYEDSKNSPLS